MVRLVSWVSVFDRVGGGCSLEFYTAKELVSGISMCRTCRLIDFNLRRVRVIVCLLLHIQDIITQSSARQSQPAVQQYPSLHPQHFA